MSDQIEIYLNDEAYEVKAGASLAELMSLKALDQKAGIAVAVNSDVIPRNDWSEKILNSKDQILVITATQGG